MNKELRHFLRNTNKITLKNGKVISKIDFIRSIEKPKNKKQTK